MTNSSYTRTLVYPSSTVYKQENDHFLARKKAVDRNQCFILILQSTTQWKRRSMQMHPQQNTIQRKNPTNETLTNTVHRHFNKKRRHAVATKFQQATTTRRKGTKKTPCPEYIGPPYNNQSIWLLKPAPDNNQQIGINESETFGDSKPSLTSQLAKFNTTSNLISEPAMTTTTNQIK